MRFNINCKKVNIKVLKHLLPNCCHEKDRPEKISFKIKEIKRNASIYFFLYNSQFTSIMC